MLPMGTIMTACMVTAFLMTCRLEIIDNSPTWLVKLFAAIMLLAGSWNVFWYALRHITEFWGVAALTSGTLMLICAAYALFPKSRIQSFRNALPFISSGLLLCAAKYGYTIYRL